MEKSEPIYCLCCSNRFESDLAFSIHACNPIFKMKGGTISVELSECLQIKRTRWARFKQRFFDLDWGFNLAFMGLVIMNYFWIRNMNLTFPEAMLEGLAWGFAIPRLLK